MKKTVISHPESKIHSQITLQEHLLSCGEKTKKYSPTSNQYKTEKMAKIIGYFHDITKCTDKFQKYLREDEICDSPHNHAPSSSLIGTAVAYKSDIDFTVQELGIIFSVINNHHGHTSTDLGQLVYRNFVDDIPSITEVTIDRINEIENSGFLHILHHIIHLFNIETETSEDIISIVEDFNKFVYKNIRFFKAELSSKSVYQEYLKLWSSLGLADISHSARISEKSFEVPTVERISNYIKGLNSNSNLDELRESYRKSVLEKSDDIDWNSIDIANLVLPTGLGKTFTGLSVATDILLFNQQISEETEYTSQTNGRIIYALPFTSIIDQVHDTLNTVLEVSCDHSTRLSKDHYLDNSTTDQSYEFLKNSWSSGITVTTFVQLFESLLAPKRTNSTKIPHLQNSVIILDEPQAIPREWWALVNKLAEVLKQEYDVTIISMTATPPRIFSLSGNVLNSSLETIDLVESPQELFKKDTVERVTYTIGKSVKEDNDMLSHSTLAEKIHNSDQKHILTICNTIDSTNAVFDNIKQKGSDIVIANNFLDHNCFEQKVMEESTPQNSILINITSRHRPVDRRKLISFINNCPPEQKLVVTSTQILEAGVDISFDKIFRDIAPLNNIAQTAGRCNRNREREQGYVEIIKLEHPEEPDTKIPSKSIYSRQIDIISITQRILDREITNSSNQISQSKLDYTLVNEYYDMLKDKHKITGKTEYIEYIHGNKLKKLSNLSLIQEGINQETIYIFDSKDQANKISDKFNEFNYDGATELLESFKDRQVSVSVWSDTERNKLEQLNTVDPNGLVLDKYTKIHSSFYSFKYGFDIPESTSQKRLL